MTTFTEGMYQDLLTTMRALDKQMENIPAKMYAHHQTIVYLQRRAGLGADGTLSTFEGIRIEERESIPLGKVLLLNHQDRIIGIMSLIDEGEQS